MLQSFLTPALNAPVLPSIPLTTDVLIIGAGPAGRTASTRLQQLGKDSLLVESLNILGGSNLVAGAVASKAFWHFIKKQNPTICSSEPHPLSYEQGKEVFEQAKNHVLNAITRENAENRKQLETQCLNGRAAFLSDGTIRVRGAEKDYIVTAQSVVVASGSRPRDLPSLPLHDEKIVSSDNILLLPELPKHIVIVGAGIVGIEYACYFRALGSEVTLMNRSDGILTSADDMISSLISQELTQLGINILSSTSVTKSHVTDELVELTLNDESNLNCNAVLVCAGRIPNVDTLDAEQIPGLLEFLHSEESKLPKEFQTDSGTIRVVTAGDSRKNSGVVGQALNHGWDVGGRLAGVTTDAHYNPILDKIPTAIFAFPPAAYTGLTQAELDAANTSYIIGEASFESNCLGNLAGDTVGQIRIYFSADDHRILGAHIVGEDAHEIINTVQVIMGKANQIKELCEAQLSYPARSRVLCQAARAAKTSPIVS